MRFRHVAIAIDVTWISNKSIREIVQRSSYAGDSVDSHEYLNINLQIWFRGMLQHILGIFCINTLQWH
jgi:hypothetical protein